MHTVDARRRRTPRRRVARDRVACPQPSQRCATRGPRTDHPARRLARLPTQPGGPQPCHRALIGHRPGDPQLRSPRRPLRRIDDPRRRPRRDRRRPGTDAGSRQRGARPDRAPHPPRRPHRRRARQRRGGRRGMGRGTAHRRPADGVDRQPPDSPRRRRRRRREPGVEREARRAPVRAGLYPRRHGHRTARPRRRRRCVSTGFRLAHERRGLPVDEQLVVSGDFGRPSGIAAGATARSRCGPTASSPPTTRWPSGVVRVFSTEPASTCPPTSRWSASTERRPKRSTSRSRRCASRSTRSPAPPSLEVLAHVSTASRPTVSR